MKKALSLLLAFVMVLSLVPMTVFAAAAPTIYFETNFTEDMTVGDTFYVTANLKDNVVFSTMTLSLKWNESAISFTGFNVDRRGGLDTEVYTYSAPVFNQELGIVTGSDYLGYDTNGRIFTANFKIIAEEGDLGIGLKTADATEFEMLDLDDKDLGTIIDTSAINGLAVGGVSSGPEMPEDAPFTAITTDVGPIVAIEEADWVNGVPHYIVTLPDDAETAYVTAPDQVVMEDWTTGAMQATAYASDLSFSGEPLYISYNYEDTADGPKVEIPMEMTVTDWSNNAVKLCFFSNDEYNPATHAFGIEDAGYACLGWISFVYDDGLEEYNISIDENIVGGTVTVIDENEEEINKAKEGDYIFLAYEANEGYRFKHYLINGNVLTEAELGAQNGCYQMPAEDITVSAVFEEEGPEIEPNPITDIEISHPNIVIDETTGTMSMAMVSGASEQIDMSFAVADAELEATQVVAWSSSNPEVATVENGKVTALKAGSTTITAKAVEASGIALLADGEDVLAEFTLTVSYPADGYAVNMGADKTVDANETVQIPVTVTHSDSNVTDYKSFEFTFQYDPALLTLVTGSSNTEGKDITVIDNNGTVTVRRYGNALNVGDAAITLEFTAKAVGNTNVKLITAKVGTTADARGEDIPTAQIVDDLTKITVSGYTVKLPQDFVGETDKPVVAPGESYTFEAKDKNYTYEVKATIDGEAITVTPNEDGTSFTIPEGEIDGNVVIEITKKEGKKFEITLNGESLAHESGYTTEGEKTYVQYMTAYTAKLTEKDHYIYELKVRVNGEIIAHDYNSETGIITIAGNLITGPVVIESGEQESDKHNVEFEGTYASHAKYEGESAVYDGEDFSFAIETPEGFAIESYEVSYKMGDAEEYTTLEATEGIYTVEDITAAVTIKIEGTSDRIVEVNEFVKLNGKTVFLVTATQTLPEGKNLAYNGNVMYLKNFAEEGADTMKQKYSYLVIIESGTLTVEEAAEMITVVEAESTILADTFNVNKSTALDINDAQLVYDLYNNVYQEIETVGMEKFLLADVNGSRNINVSDAAAVVDAIINPTA